MDGELNVEIYRPDPRPKFYFDGPLGNTVVRGLVFTVPEMEALVEKLNEALAEAELG